MQTLEILSQLLKKRIGLEVASIGEASLKRAVDERLMAHPTLEASRYVELVSQHPAELQALVEAVVVGETWFFRYPLSFVAMVELVRAELKKKPLTPVQLLSLPCSSGEEPYSMAMGLLDAGILPEQFQITAMDVSEQALIAAKQGIYGRNSFRGEDVRFRQRYFHEQDGQYALADRVKNCVQFVRGNVLELNASAYAQRFHLVFCRNLLIYFDRATQLQALNVLKQVTQKTGALFIGPAEASLFSAAGLTPLSFSQAFAFSLVARRAPSAKAEPVKTKPQSKTPKVLPAPKVKVKPKAQPKTRPETSLAEALEDIKRLADQGQHQPATELTQTLLSRFGPHAQLYYWQALLAEVVGELEKAQALYRKVLYLEPNHQEALAHLAMLLVSQGDTEAAKRLQRRISSGNSL